MGLLTLRHSVARDQERSGYPGRSLSRTQKIKRTAGPSYTCHAERSEASQRYVVAGGPAAQCPRGAPLCAPDGVLFRRRRARCKRCPPVRTGRGEPVGHGAQILPPGGVRMTQHDMISSFVATQRSRKVMPVVHRHESAGTPFQNGSLILLRKEILHPQEPVSVVRTSLVARGPCACNDYAESCGT